MLAMENDAKNHECPDVNVWGSYTAGQLAEPELGQCEAHLEQCEQCAETIRRLSLAEPADESFDQLVMSSLQGPAQQHVSYRAEGDGPLVDQLIRDLVQRAPNPDQAMRALENRAAEVNRLLPPSDVPGSIGSLGGYDVKRLLGAGSTGVVYEAMDGKLQRRVALKVLRPSLGDAARKRFANEAQAAAAIIHPNVITIYQVEEANDLAFIAMELSDGQTLESRLNEVAFVPETDLKRTAKQIAEGLAAAHGHGLIHRDIKPANIWLRAADGQAVILDFGLARIADDDPQLTATGMLAGTPNFMSPEQTRGLELDGRSDLFSLGCLMYRAATGKLPFGSTGILATLQAIQHDDSRPPILLNPHLTADFSDLVMTLLEKQPANRPSSAEELVAALSADRSQWKFKVASNCESKQETARLAAASRTPIPPTATKKSKLRKWAMAALLLASLGANAWVWFLHDWKSKPVASARASNSWSQDDSSPADAFVQNNLRQILLGWHNHESTRMHLPSISKGGPVKKRALSWRVHILPHMEREDLYSKFKLDQTWDSPHNITLLKEMPEVYSSPTDTALNKVGMTRFQAPTGDGLILDPGQRSNSKGVTFEDITDGSANTMAVIQVAKDRAVEWTKPQDWDFDEDNVVLDLLNKQGRTWFATADGTVHSLRTPADGHFVKALVTRAGGELFDFTGQTASLPPAFGAQPGGMAMGRMEMGDMGMGMGMDMDMDMGMDGLPNDPPPALYAGKTFNKWMQVVKNDRQLKTKFDALAATAELAQGDDELKQQVMNQIKPLLRKYGSRFSGGGDPFQSEHTQVTVKNRFRNSELTHLFVEILRRFPADDLMDLAIDEIKHGTANSREFLTWLWLPSSMREDDRAGQTEYFHAIDRHAVEIASSVLKAAETCDQASRDVLIDTIATVGSNIGLDLKPGKDPLVQLNAVVKRDPSDKILAEWNRSITEAFESDKPIKQGFVAVAMAQTNPDRPGLAEDLTNLLANKDVLPELRASGLFALEELPFEKIKPVATKLIAIGKQSGPEKDKLTAWTSKHQHWPSNQQVPTGLMGGYPISADYQIGYLLSQLDEPPEELLPWLKELKSKAEADPGQPQFGGGPDYAVENRKKAIAAALQAIDPDAEPYEFPQSGGGGGGGGVF